MKGSPFGAAPQYHLGTPWAEGRAELCRERQRSVQESADTAGNKQSSVCFHFCPTPAKQKLIICERGRI